MVQNKNLKFQNLLLLVASYFFYACWDYRFLFLLIFSTLLDFYSGIKINESNSPRNRKIWFWTSILINLGFLGLFKYFNFFAESFVEAFSAFGVEISPWTLNVILPIGISFYTFHGLSYIIDIYKGRIDAERNFIDYAVFVCFFPLLVAGPIERATHLLPQIKQKRAFEHHKIIDGLRQILWGLFKKVVIADGCAEYANMIFNHSDQYSGSTLFLGAVLFSLQIYGDFSGYSDIALGTARLFGIELLRNFAFPYFSRDISEFWRRWHISLTTWFRDYLYIPLGGSRGGRWAKVRNTFVIFLVSGFWHGANWTFIVWGLINAIYFLPLLLTDNNRIHLNSVAAGSNFPSLKELFQMGGTFLLSVFAWIFFRSEDLAHAFEFFRNMFVISFFKMPVVFPTTIILLCLFFLLVEWLGREKQYALAYLEDHLKMPYRWSFYFIITLIIIANMGGNQAFIYFQF